MTGILLRYKGSTRAEIVWRIPLDYLIYNKYNGRIGSDVLSYETQNGELNAESDSDREIIEKFLYESKVDRNKTTMDSLLKTVSRDMELLQLMELSSMVTGVRCC